MYYYNSEQVVVVLVPSNNYEGRGAIIIVRDSHLRVALFNRNVITTSILVPFGHKCHQNS